MSRSSPPSSRSSRRLGEPLTPTPGPGRAPGTATVSLAAPAPVRVYTGRVETDRLFLAALDELTARARPRSPEFDLVRAAGLLRELLLDERPLVHQVKRRGRPTPTFRIRRRKPDYSGEPWWWLDALDADTVVTDAMAGPVETVRLPGLLAVPMICLGAADRSNREPFRYLTVRDLVRYHAHVAGGVHRSPAKEPLHLALEEFPLKIGFGTVPMEAVAIACITSVVLKGLDPLRRAIQAEVGK